MDRSSSSGALCQSACFWHCLQRWACRAQSSFTVGQKNPARITLEAKDLPPTWLPQMPSWSSTIIPVHSSPLTHVRIGWVNPCLNNTPSTNVYLAEFLLTFLPSSGSTGRVPSAKYHLYGVIQVSPSARTHTSICLLSSGMSAYVLMRGVFSVSWVRER